MSANVTFKVIKYYKRPRGEGGPWRSESMRLDIGKALGWLLAELPRDSYEMRIEGKDGDGAAQTTVVIDWTKVPAEIKDARS